MASFGEQFEASRKTNQAIRALEVSVRMRIAEAFADWVDGRHSDQSVRWAMEAIIRDAYRSAAAVGLAHLSAQAGVPRWKPTGMRVEVLRSAYLDGLLEDVRKNLREYKAGPHDDAARARFVSRIAHSAGVAASRGHTDALLRGARELVDTYGFVVRKVWRANFVNHVPCELCGALEGTEVGLGEEFPSDNRLKVYGDLKGPPRHPRCMCWLVILIEGLENYNDSTTEDSTTSERETLSTDEVQKMSPGFFVKIVHWLRKLVRTLRSADE